MVSSWYTVTSSQMLLELEDCRLQKGTSLKLSYPAVVAGGGLYSFYRESVEGQLSHLIRVTKCEAIISSKRRSVG